MSARVPTIELHRHGAAPTDLTDHCVSVSWTDQVSPPWGGIEAVFKLPRHLLATHTPRPADWLLVRLGKTAVALGYVTRRSGGIKADGRGGIFTDYVHVSAGSWLQPLTLAQLYVTYSGARGGADYEDRAGTAFGWNSWRNVIEALVRSTVAAVELHGVNRIETAFMRRDIGEALRELWRELAVVTLPETLGGGDGTGNGLLLGRHAEVVHDPNTRKAFAPDRVVERVPGWTLNGLSQLTPGGNSVTGMLFASFMGDPGMMEMFPSLEAPGVPEEAPGDLRGYLSAEALGRVDTSTFTKAGLRLYKALGLQDRNVLEEAMVKRDLDRARALRRSPPVRLASGLAKVLGRNPVLLYRMRPWRVSPLKDYVRGQGAGFHVGDTSTVRGAAQLDIDEDLFTEVTWDASTAPVIPRDKVMAVTWTADDAAAVTMVTDDLPMQAQSVLRFMEELQLPIVQKTAPGRATGPMDWRGARLYQPNWPFFPPYDGKNQPLARFIRTIAAQAAQWHMGRERFESGTLTLKYSPAGLQGRPLRHGEPIRVQMPAGVPGGELTAYVESVTHTFTANGPTITATTTVQFSRGLFDERARELSGARGLGGVAA